MARDSPEASSSRRYERQRDRDDYRPFRPRSHSPERRRGENNIIRRSPSVSSSEGSDRNRRSHKSSRSRDSETREERKERKRAKRERREAKDAKRAAKDEKRKRQMGVVTSEYGKYGILTDADIFTKDAEFRTWLVEEKKINPETITQQKSKEMFRSFAEDFNTCTLPHLKYYALDDYERKMRAVRMGEDMIPDTGYDPRADEEAARASHRKSSKNDQPAPVMSKEQLLDLQRVQRERVESSKMKRLGMEVKDSVGVRYQ